MSATPVEELRALPDLGERLVAVVQDLPEVEVGTLYGRFVARHRDGRVIALASGIGDLKFHVGQHDVARAIALGAAPDPELGGGWVRADAWNSAVRTAAWLDKLRALAAMAHQYASRPRSA